MTLALTDHAVLADDRPLLTGLADAFSAEPDSFGVGLFLVAQADWSASRHRFAVGVIPSLARFTVCHRYEPYWMKPCAGSRLQDVPAETQMLLARLTDDRWLLLVPLVDDRFRFSLRGRADDTLELLAETGDAHTPGAGGRALFVAVGQDPFTLTRRGACSVLLVQ